MFAIPNMSHSLLGILEMLNHIFNLKSGRTVIFVWVITDQ